MTRSIKAVLFPAPQSLRRRPGFFTLPKPAGPEVLQFQKTDAAPDHPEGYTLEISPQGVTFQFREPSGLRAALATWTQLLREYGCRIPCLTIRDWPDFARRGVMLDVSRGRVPRLETLIELAGKLAALKINELQLYTEHTFAYAKYRRVWSSWGALTGQEIRQLDRHCRELGIDLVPNQNSFGHLREFLADGQLKKLAELVTPYEAETGDFLRRPTTLAPRHPGTKPFLRGLYDELLPNFSSAFFNVGCDETWDLGKGRSRAVCAAKGKGRVYLNFLKAIHREVAARGKHMMFWGDIILKYPDLIRELARLSPAPSANEPGGEVIALNWGYEADHPFAKEAAQFAQAGLRFYVCPGTSTWQTLIGKHDNALANLKAAARTGKKFGAHGYLVTDWGDGGHPQPLAVSWPIQAAGAGLAWNSRALNAAALERVLNCDIFEDASGQVSQAAMALGRAHRRLNLTAPNETPLGTVIAAPRPADRELFCRNGLKWFTKIPPGKILAAWREIERQRMKLQRSKPASNAGLVLAMELDLAAQMAAISCRYMLWQQAAGKSKLSEAKPLAKALIRDLARVEQEYTALWPLRNKATPKHSVPFLQWRQAELQRWLATCP